MYVATLHLMQCTTLSNAFISEIENGENALKSAPVARFTKQMTRLTITLLYSLKLVLFM